MPDAAPTSPADSRPRRWSIFAAGFLLLALALVVIYTSRPAFSSPLALVVVAAIGLAALLLQLRLRKDLSVRAPLWLNLLGLAFAVTAIFVDVFHLASNFMLIAALGAVVCFAVSATIILRALRRKNPTPKTSDIGPRTQDLRPKT